jgi:hypothetical protein
MVPDLGGAGPLALDCFLLLPAVDGLRLPGEAALASSILGRSDVLLIVGVVIYFIYWQ